jgi:peptidyl-prolyl cis-trans isomerase B (cyclophilin B)
MKRKKILALLLALALFGALAACGQNQNQTTGGESAMTNPAPKVTDANGKKYPVATITIGSVGSFKGGVVVAELYPEVAPNTVNNFISLAKENYFKGKVFHRAVPTFMIQGGSPKGDGTSIGFPYSIKGEFSSNGYAANNLSHTPGVLSLARTNDPDSAGCQFFIMHAESTFLDGQYAAFGQVTKGMDVVDRIATLPTMGEELVDKPVITGVTVETFGVNYAAPVTIPAVQ